MKDRWVRAATCFVLLLVVSTMGAQTGPPAENLDPGDGGWGGGACEYWDCRYTTSGGASCWIALWSTGSRAKGCGVVCDGGTCWCEYRTPCYSV